MKHLLLSAVSWLAILPAAAQNVDSIRTLAAQQRRAEAAADSLRGWRGAYQGTLTANQAAFSGNWAGGGVNSYALTSTLDATAEYRSGRFSWGSQFVGEYGLQSVRDEAVRKTADRLLLESRAAYQLRPASPWAVFAAVNLLTQFDVGYAFTEVDGQELRTPISRFLSPGFLTESIGLEYRPTEAFATRLGLATLRQTVMTDTSLFRGRETYFGVNRNRQVRLEAGFWLTADYNQHLTETITLTAKLSAFGNYLKLTTVDTRLDLLATAKLWKRLSVTLGAAAVYFQEVSPGLQYSQTLGLGLTLDRKWQ